MLGVPFLTALVCGFDNGLMSGKILCGLTCTFLLLISCDGGQNVSAALGEVPDTVSENFRQVTVSSGGRVEIEAGKVEGFSKRDVTVFSDAGMRELNKDGEKTLEGEADRIEVTGDRDGTADGSIRIQDFIGDSRLEAEHFEWDDEKRILTGDGEVRIDSGDGLTIIGEGFIADTARGTYRFTDGVEGYLELNDES